MSIESKIAPCPFCGCGAALSQTTDGWWAVHCTNVLCAADRFNYAKLEASTPVGAIILWNDAVLKEKEKNNGK